MYRPLTRTLAAFLLFVHADAHACAMDDCTLSDASHRVGHDAHVDAFSWMNHDLAAARFASVTGDGATAIDTVHALDRAMRAQIDALVQSRGSDHVDQLHRSLQRILARLDATPLPALLVPVHDAIAIL